jgi:hypothetical protein
MQFYSGDYEVEWKAQTIRNERRSQGQRVDCQRTAPAVSQDGIISEKHPTAIHASIRHESGLSIR